MELGLNKGYHSTTLSTTKDHFQANNGMISKPRAASLMCPMTFFISMNCPLLDEQGLRMESFLASVKYLVDSFMSKRCQFHKIK